ncbi:hypothetical protein V6N13_118401 [Hibiscus sabdariffa]|uniref:Uncharacterized protein n=1 Tax=Hibiscus sabdariffa TaxID=183260 RepID=A0ABR2Q8F2_9ROSI
MAAFDKSAPEISEADYENPNVANAQPGLLLPVDDVRGRPPDNSKGAPIVAVPVTAASTVSFRDMLVGSKQGQSREPLSTTNNDADTSVREMAVVPPAKKFGPWMHVTNRCQRRGVISNLVSGGFVTEDGSLASDSIHDVGVIQGEGRKESEQVWVSEKAGGSMQNDIRARTMVGMKSQGINKFANKNGGGSTSIVSTEPSVRGLNTARKVAVLNGDENGGDNSGDGSAIGKQVASKDGVVAVICSLNPEKHTVIKVVS